MKKLFSILLLALSWQLISAAIVQINDVYYSLSGTEAYVTNSNGSYNGVSSCADTINIPSSITYGSRTYQVVRINDYAFRSCETLAQISIPATVTYIYGYITFGGCTNLKNILVDSANPNYCSVDGVMFNKDTTQLILYPRGRQGEYSIPETVTEIGVYAFEGCVGLTDITIPESVTVIGGGAFSGCTALQTVVIPQSVTTLDYYVFGQCSSLSSVTLPDNLTNVGEGIFEGCTSLTTPIYTSTAFLFMPPSYSGAYTIPDGIEKIMGIAFEGCTNITSITLPESVISIGEVEYDEGEPFCTMSPFMGCTNLTSPVYNSRLFAYMPPSVTGSYIIPEGIQKICCEAFASSKIKEVTMPNSVTQIGDGVFRWCDSLENITLSENITAIPSDMFWNSKSLKSINIPDNVTSIGWRAFESCSALAEVTLGVGVQTLSGYAFGSCTSLRKITLPEGLTTLDQYVFDRCTALDTVVLPSTLTSINQYAFQNCPQTITVICYATQVPTNNLTNANLIVYVPSAVVDLYKSNSGWSKYQIYPIENEVTLVLNAQNGTAVGGGAYHLHDSVTIRTVPDEGYAFSYWSDFNTENPRTIRLTQTTTTLTAICLPIDSAVYDLCLADANEHSVYFIKPDNWGQNINCYMWHYGTYNELTNSWPGNKATAFSERLYKYKIPESWGDIGDDWMIIWNDGSHQTEDHRYVNNGVFSIVSDVSYMHGNLTTINYVCTRVCPDAIVDVYDTICEGKPYYLNQLTYESGDYAIDRTYISSHGGDSIVHYHLNVHYCEQTKYIITFVDYDGTVLQSGEVIEEAMLVYNGETPQRPHSLRWTYTFRKWHPDLAPATADATYTALYDSIISYDCAHLLPITSIDTIDSVRLANAVSSVRAKVGMHYDGKRDIDTLALHNGLRTLVDYWNQNPFTAPVIDAHIVLDTLDFTAGVDMTDVCGNNKWKGVLVDVYPVAFDTVRVYGIIPDTVTSIIRISIPNSTAKYDSVAVHITKCTPNLPPLGLFNHLSPADSAIFDNTNLTLNWNLIEDALFSVYLWDADEEPPYEPVAEYINDIRYQPANIQFGHTYHWYVQAQSCGNIVVSDTLTFSIRELPDLHVISLDLSDAEAEQPITVTWKVRNDGPGATGQQRWMDYIWLVNDAWFGTTSTIDGLYLPKLLTQVDNVKSLESGEQYENSVTVRLPDHVYGDIYVIVSTDMYRVTDIEWDSVGGVVPNPYNPQETGWLYANTDAADNKIYEQGETPTRSDNFFFKQLHLDIPPYVDLQVSSVTAEAVPLDPPYITGYGKVALTCKANKKYFVDAQSSAGDSPSYANTHKAKEAIDTVKLYNPSPVTYSGAAFNLDFYCGKEVAVNAYIVNRGTKKLDTCGWNNAVHISHTPTLDASAWHVKSEYVSIDSLMPGDSIPVKISFEMPYGWYGDTYFHVQADINDNVQEFANTANNFGVSDAVNVKLTPYADFEPENLQISANGSTTSLVAGQKFNLSCVVKNIGNGIPYSGMWKNRVYISASPDGIDASEDKLIEWSRSGRFEKNQRAEDNAVLVNAAYYIRLSDFEYKGDNYNCNYVLTTPALPSGIYYIYVQVDADNDVFENEGENNNILCSEPIQITTADLAIDNFSISQDTLTTGDVVALTYKVRNVGDMPLQNSKLVDALYVKQGNNSPLQIATVQNTVSLPVGGEKTLRANITVPRNQTLDGLFNIYMLVNDADSIIETNKTNNVSSNKQVVFSYLENGSEQTINGMALQAGNLSLEQTNYNLGDTVTLSAIITNIGTKTIQMDVTKEICLMEGYNAYYTNSASTPLNVLSCAGSTAGLAPHQSVEITMTALLPEDIRGGDYRIFFVADRMNAIKARSTAHSVTSSLLFINGNMPDIVVSDIQCPDTIYTSVEDTMSFVIGNNGTWMSSPFTAFLYLSKEAQFDNTGIELARVSIPALQIGGQTSIRVPVTLNDRYSGSYFVIVKPDMRFTNLSDDNKMASKSVYVALSPLSDLQISELNLSSTLIAGEKLQISYSIENKGAAATRTAKWADDFYICSTSTFDVDKAVKLGSRTHIGVLEPDSSYTCTVEYTIPQSLQGNYMFFIRTDAADAIVESDEQNNIISQPVYINNGNDRPADLLISTISVPANITAGQPLTFSYTVANRGEYPASGMLRDVFYLSENSQLDASDQMIGVASGMVSLTAGEEAVRTATGIIGNVTEGSYYLIITTNSTHGIAERDYENNTSVSSTPVTIQFAELPMESELSFTNTAYYKLEVSSAQENKTIAIDLKHPATRTASVCVSYDKVPSISKYDYISVNLDNASQQLILPHVKSGTYYIFAQDHATMSQSVGNEFSLEGMSAVNAAEMTISAKEIPFGASSLTISEGGEGGWITTGINGALFESIMDFRLAQSTRMMPAEVVTWDGATQSMVTFNLNDAALGEYDVVSELPDGTTGTLEKAFRVVEGKEVGVSVKLDVPGTFRPNTAIPFSFYYANGGTIDDAISEFLIVIENGWLSFDAKGLEEHVTELHYRPHGETNARGYVSIPPGEQKIVNAYYQGTDRTCTISIYILK